MKFGLPILTAGAALLSSVEGFKIPRCDGPQVEFPEKTDTATCDETSYFPISGGSDSFCDREKWFGFEFQSCCAASPLDQDLIEESRTIPFERPVLDPCSNKLLFNITSWTEGEVDACCQSCKCYGDPHCKSFLKDSDTWVTCDTRIPVKGVPGGCKGTGRNTDEHKNECYGTGAIHSDNSKSKCTYNAQRSWDWANRGSRCQIKKGANPTMLMYRDDDMDFSVYLIMGERGVIDKVRIEEAVDGGKKEYTIHAKGGYYGCSQWVTEEGVILSEYRQNLPEGWDMDILRDGTIQDAWWTIESPKTKLPIMSIQCLGYKDTRPPVDRRINIKISNAQSVADQTSDESFCKSGRIAEATREDHLYCATEGRPDWPEWKEECMDLTRQYCVGSMPKNVAEFTQLWAGRESLDMVQIFEACAKRWCERRELPADVSVRECVDDVADFKFLGGSRLYSRMKPDEDGVLDCVPFVSSDYPTSAPEDECIEHMQIKIYKEDTEEWVDYKYIPRAEYCPGWGFTKESDPDLFAHQVALSQNKCNKLGQRCNAWGELKGEARYTSDCAAVSALLALPFEEGGYHLVRNSDGHVLDMPWSVCESFDGSRRALKEP